MSGESRDRVDGVTADGFVIDDGACLRMRLSPGQRRMSWIRLTVRVAVWLVLVTIFVIKGEFAALLVPLLLAIPVWWQFRRTRRAMVGPEGIRPPAAAKFTPWTAVEHVQTPGRFASTVMVKLSDQSVLDTGFPASCADRIAAIGAKTVINAARPQPTPAPTHRRRPEPSVDERAAALRKRNAELLDGLQRRTRRNEPPSSDTESQ